MRVHQAVKILICVNHFWPHVGGCERITQRLGEYFISLGHDVIVLTRWMDERASKTLNGIQIQDYKTATVDSVLRTVKSIDPDWLFIYSDVFDFARPLLSVRWRGKVALIPIGFNGLLKQPIRQTEFNNQLLKNINALVFKSKNEHLYEDILRRCPEKIYIIPNGVDLFEFDQNNLTRFQLCPEHNEKTWILNVANFFPGKGQNYMFPILDRLLHKDFVYFQAYAEPKHQFDTVLEAQWKTVAKKQSYPVVPLRGLSREKLVGFFKNSNILVSTSIKEVSPNIFLEAIAANTPWVSTDIGNVGDLPGGICVKAPKDKSQQSVFHDFVIQKMSETIDAVLQTTIMTSGEYRSLYDWKHILPLYLKLIGV